MIKKKITVAKGDGIGPEIMEATLRILEAAGAQIETEEIEVGEQVYLSGNTSGISRASWDVIRKNKIFLKGPITTPQGGGYKSLNVSTRKFLGLFANVRPCRSFAPFVRTRHPNLDLVVIRENEEDLYAGIEHQQTDEVVQCLKLISRPGCEKIVRYAFEYARQNGRRKVSCFTKDNIMKQTDGLFRTVFNEIAGQYPEIQSEHMIVDIGTAKVADTPEDFDVIVLPNLYGDILSDITAQIAGSVGLGGSSNVGEECAMFEAIHGSAPGLAGKDIANPSGLLHGAIMMLTHIGQPDVAQKIYNAWLCTIEQGVHTYDLYHEDTSTHLAGTQEFAQAIIANLGKEPLTVQPVRFHEAGPIVLPRYIRVPARQKELIGVDVFLHWRGRDPEELAQELQEIRQQAVFLSMVTNRGIKVWPDGFKETFCTDHWRCRFQVSEGATMLKQHIVDLLRGADEQGLDVIKTENLYSFDGVPAYSLGQGQ